MNVDDVVIWLVVERRVRVSLLWSTATAHLYVAERYLLGLAQAAVFVDLAP